MTLAATLRAQSPDNFSRSANDMSRHSAGRPASEATGREVNGVYTETEVPHSWFSFSKPAMKTPKAQLLEADRLLALQKIKAAGKAYHSLVLTWPREAEAAEAQQRYAETLAARGEPEDAFDAYDILIDRYTGSFEYEAVIATQFDLAKQVMNKRRGSLLMFGGWKAPERAIPMFESIIKNAPRWQGAAEAQYLVGQANELMDEMELAIVAYMSAQNRYPDSPFAEKAALGRARALISLSDESPNDDEALDQAYAAVVLFLQAYPKSEQVDLMTGQRDTLLKRRAKIAYDRGVFYDKIARNPKAALLSYESYLRMYPKSEWASQAQERIAQLRPLIPATTARP